MMTWDFFITAVGSAISRPEPRMMLSRMSWRECCLTKKAEPPPTGDVNRDSGTDSANGGWLRRLVRPQVYVASIVHK